jgi:ubiquinol-cytochrome c reductase cytochrome b subunit
MYIGGAPAEGIYLLIGRIATAFWFAFFFILAPLVSLVEKPLPMPQSIHEFEDWKKQGKIKVFQFFGK